MRPDVWAPRAQRVEVHLGDGRRQPLVRVDDGWWSGGPALRHGDRYGFVLDGGPVLPDPRSRWQPDGVHGLSAVDDPAALPWTDADWSGVDLRGGAIYELHVGTWTPDGTLDAAIGRLGHVAELGVAAVELLPVAEAMGRRGWGYDGVDLFAVHHAYGGPAALRRFVDAAHALGLGVLLDVVYNHLGPEGAHLADFGPYFTDAHHTPWGPAVNLDAEGSSEVRRFLIDNALQWCDDFHVDGLRIDAAHALLDGRPSHIVAEIAAALAELSERTGVRRWVAIEKEEPEHDPLRDRSTSGWGVDLRWADDLHHALHARLTGERSGYYEPFGATADVVTALQHGHVPPGEPRPADVAPSQLITCTQNHDQIGNRAEGERLSALVGPDAACAAAALVLLGPGTPLLFMGEEWAASTPFPFFCDTDDPDLARRISEGRRSEFADFAWDDVPDPLAEATFRSAVLRWDELHTSPHREVHAWYRTLLQIRRRERVLRDGPVGAVRAVGDVVVMERGRHVVLAHLGSEPTTVEVDGTLVARHGDATARDAAWRLGPHAAVVLARS